jgi:hypothetical protein
MIQATSGPATSNGPNAWNQKERGTEKQSPYPAPEGSHFSPVFHTVAGIVVADHVFFSVNVGSNNRKFFHVEATLNCPFNAPVRVPFVR